MAISYPKTSMTEQSVVPSSTLSFLWLEITGKCNLACAHCYAGSSPQGNHGNMQRQDWERVLFEASALNCKSIQFIGGEPTVHPDLVHLLSLASSLEMSIEVYTNLVRMNPALWSAFQSNNVKVATSFYSANAGIHEEITRGQNSFQKTVRNIEQAIALGIPLRAGLVKMRPDQKIEEAEAFLRNLGVNRIGKDTVRSVGRGETYVQVEQPEQALCGACASGKACVVSSGDVYPCVFSRWLRIGNVLSTPLQDIITSRRMTQTRQELALFFINRRTSSQNCDPDDEGCQPEGLRGASQKRLLRTPCMPDTEQYLITQDLSGILPVRTGCEPYECNPNCEPGQSGCNPDNQGCPPTNLCVPDFKDPCPPQAPCPPDQEACPPDWDQ